MTIVECFARRWPVVDLGGVTVIVVCCIALQVLKTLQFLPMQHRRLQFTTIVLMSFAWNLQCKIFMFHIYNQFMKYLWCCASSSARRFRITWFIIMLNVIHTSGNYFLPWSLLAFRVTCIVLVTKYLNTRIVLLFPQIESSLEHTSLFCRHLRWWCVLTESRTAQNHPSGWTL